MQNCVDRPDVADTSSHLLLRDGHRTVLCGLAAVLVRLFVVITTFDRVRSLSQPPPMLPMTTSQFVICDQMMSTSPLLVNLTVCEYLPPP